MNASLTGLRRSGASRAARGAFTLIEILIVVLILGILAAIVLGASWNVTMDAQGSVTYSELKKLRRHMEAYHIVHRSLPAVTAGNGTWGAIIGPEFLLSAPVNAWVDSANNKRIILRNTPDTGYQAGYAWIFDPATGRVWAGGFDQNDQPFPK
ncbi:MAG TPA: prepilin-type N-terminal cleavage/methylation domain-containing protein [Phycisphaerales bacterium]|nr:prepilin-type N-terminal cleavage/methylation domain-containing protein [Phycisphaerales bacterium]